MKDRYLEVTFRKGKAIAAYLYLPRLTGVKAVRTREAAPGIIVDYDEHDRPIGLEILSPSHVTIDAINNVLALVGIPSMPAAELAPLQAA